MQLCASTQTNQTKWSMIALVLVLFLLIVNDLVIVYSLRKSILEIRQSAKKPEVDEQFSRLNGELDDLGQAFWRMNNRMEDLGQAFRRMNNQMEDLNVYRSSLTFTFKANVTDLVIRDSKIGANAKLFSETFYLRGVPFYLRLSVVKTDTKYLSIFLKSHVNSSDDADRPFGLQYELSILSHPSDPRNVNVTVKGERTFERQPYGFGFSKFAAFTELFESGLIKEDAIRLQATLATQ